MAKWRLGRRLRELREHAGVTIAEAAREAGINAGTVSKIESGKQACKTAFVNLWGRMYVLTDDERAELAVLAAEAQQPGWWSNYSKSVPDWFRLAVAYESEASTIFTYEASLVPGLFQTAATARALALANWPDAAPDDVDRQVELRAMRQQRLFDADPPTVRAILDEAVLMRPVGGDAVFAAQIAHLIEMAKLPHISIRVLPFSAGAHPAMTAPFLMLGFDAEPGMDTVYLENGRGSVYLDAPADRAMYADKFHRLELLACGHGETEGRLSSLRAQYL
ncbi:MAG TPA: helix-turn-helix transcriptional regulator [Actinokineospora sp.]|nr:helix-turn-helix transcriptional regulator [Actinokineospora sp.]